MCVRACVHACMYVCGMYVFIDSYGFSMAIMGVYRPLLFFSDGYWFSMEIMGFHSQL